jgi:hypothetical protein
MNKKLILIFLALGMITIPMAAEAKKAKGKRKPAGAPAAAAVRITAPAVRAAIEDMMKTFGADYPRGAEFLQRLETAQGPTLEKLQQEALLANPLVRDVSLVYTSRRQFKKDHHNTATIFQHGEVNEASYDPPGKLRIVNLKTGAVKTLVDAGPTGIARDPEISADGQRVVFAMRKSITDDYHIYEINVDGSGLKQLTSLKGVSDIDPVYLPDGKIVFSSTREPKFCMCNIHIMVNLYRMDADGANIHQIGKSTLFEGHGSVMDNGSILYDRWEYTDRNFGDAQGLWLTNPDGTMHSIFYGNNTSSPGGVIDGRQIPGTSKVIATFGSCHDVAWGALAILDRNKGVDGAEPVAHIWPASARNLIGKGNYDTFKKVNPKYEDPFPLADAKTLAGSGKYFLCSRTTGKTQAIFLIDVFGNEVLVHQEQGGMSCFDPMPLVSRQKGVARPDQRDFENKNGTFYVQDVYEGTHMKGVKRGEVKFLRVVTTPEKRSWIEPRWSGGGRQSPGVNWHSLEAKEILGTVPVEDDGSAYFEVPSDVFFHFQLLDKDGKMIQSMRSGTIIQSGERQGCIGCHESRVGAPPVATTGLKALMRPPSKMGEGYGAGRPYNYLAEVQPVFDKHCVSCHDFGKPAGDKVNLAGDKGLVFNASYLDLHRKKIVKVANAGPAQTLPAKAWGSHASKLTAHLQGHKEVKLTAEEKMRVYTWMDINGVYYPTYDCAFPENQAGRSPLNDNQLKQLLTLCKLNPAQMIGARGKMTGYKGNPGALISFDRPERSPMLNGLPKGSAPYKQALAIIQQGADILKATPRADMPGFVPCDNHLQRGARYEELRRKENAFRAAAKDGRKLYDADVQLLNGK